jgi:hypothetical protein
MVVALAEDASQMRSVARDGYGFRPTLEKNLRRPTEILFGPLVLDWRGDSLRLVN